MSGRRALYPVCLPDRGSHTLLESRALVGEQTAGLQRDQPGRGVRRTVQPVTAQDVTDDDQLRQVTLQARREESRDPTNRVGLAVVGAPPLESVKILERRVPLVERIVHNDLPSSARRSERVIGKVARIPDVPEHNIDGALRASPDQSGAR